VTPGASQLQQQQQQQHTVKRCIGASHTQYLLQLHAHITCHCAGVGKPERGAWTLAGRVCLLRNAPLAVACSPAAACGVAAEHFQVLTCGYCT
jgi:hypothetical protein